MTTEILSDRGVEYFIAGWTLVPESGGVFDVIVNDDVLFSKKGIGRHAEPGEIKALLQERVDAYKTEQGIAWQEIPESD